MPDQLGRYLMEALYLVLLLSGPVLVVSLVVGLAVGVLQVATQLQEHSLVFVPRILAVATTLVFAGGWLARQLVEFVRMSWSAIPHLFA